MMSRKLLVAAGILFFVASIGYFVSDRNGTGAAFLALGAVFLALSAGQGRDKAGPEDN